MAQGKPRFPDESIPDPNKEPLPRGPGPMNLHLAPLDVPLVALHSVTPGALPPAGKIQGELWVNIPDKKFGVIDSTGTPVELGGASGEFLPLAGGAMTGPIDFTATTTWRTKAVGTDYSIEILDADGLVRSTPIKLSEDGTILISGWPVIENTGQTELSVKSLTSGTILNLGDTVGTGTYTNINMKAPANKRLSLSLYAGIDYWSWSMEADKSFVLTANALVFDYATKLGTVVGDPTVPLGIATKQYVDSLAGPVALSAQTKIDELEATVAKLMKRIETLEAKA